MKRGDIVLTIGRGDFPTKPRPSIVVQSDLFNADHPAITVCPITSRLTGDSLFRVALSADDTIGLRRDSEIEIDLVQAIRRERLGDTVGTASEQVMALVDQALRRWLAL